MIIDNYENLLPDEGHYRSIAREYKEGEKIENKHGINRSVDVTYDLLGTGNSRSRRYIAIMSPGSALRKLFKTILGEVPEVADMKLLLDKECIVEIKYNTSETGVIFANVADVISIDKIDEYDIINEGLLEDSEDDNNYDQEVVI